MTGAQRVADTTVGESGADRDDPADMAAIVEAVP
jgi:hypothetical protein